MFAEDEWWITPSFALTGGLRYTEHESYGGEWTPRLYAVWNATDGLTIKGGVSTGFKAPGVRQTVDGYYATQRRWTNPVPRINDLTLRRIPARDPEIAYRDSEPAPLPAQIIATSGRTEAQARRTGVISSRSTPAAEAPAAAAPVRSAPPRFPLRAPSLRRTS